MNQGAPTPVWFLVTLVKAARTPMRDPGWVSKTLLGGLTVFVPYKSLMLLFTTFFQPAFVLLYLLALFCLLIGWGYLFRIFVDALNGNEGGPLPGWGDWKRFGLAGLWLLCIVLGYLFLASVGLSPIFQGIGVGSLQGNQQGMAMVLLVGMLFSVGLCGFYPIAFARFAASGRVWAAFEPITVWRDIRRIVRSDYIQACTIFYGLYLAIHVATSWIPYGGLPLLSLLIFYLTVVFARVFGAMIGRSDAGVLEEKT